MKEIRKQEHLNLFKFRLIHYLHKIAEEFNKKATPTPST
jgi:hypothetical protein